MAHHLPPLEAPEHLRGRMNYWTDDKLKQERMEWAAEAGRRGYSSAAVAAALGLKPSYAEDIMRQGGWTGCIQLPPLVAPENLRGRMTKWTDPELRHERMAWAAEAGRRGYSSYEVGAALGISQHSAHRTMVEGGWDAFAHLRQNPAPKPIVKKELPHRGLSRETLEPLAASGMTVSQIASHLGYSYKHVHHRLSLYKIKFRRAGRRFSTQSPHST